MLSYLKEITFMRKREKSSINFGELRREIDKLFLPGRSL
jgi:hypothetical protein